MIKHNDPKPGDTRVVGKFLFLPLSIKTRTEDGKIVNDSRWLEYAEVNQEYQAVEYWEHWAGGFRKYINYEWINISWVEEE